MADRGVGQRAAPPPASGHSSIATRSARSFSQAPIPFLFLHERYQPDLSVGAGATTVDIRLSDLAVLVVVAFAAAAAVRTGVSHLRAARALWVSGAALLVWLAFQTFRPVSLDDALFDDTS